MIKKRNALALLLGAFAMIACLFMSCKMGDDDDDDNETSVIQIADYSIKIPYSDTPAIGSEATAKIYKNETLVDTIKASDEKLYGIGSSKGAMSELSAADQLMVVEDNSIVVIPHNDDTGYSILEPGTSYKVVLDGVTGTLEAETYTFTTKKAQSISNKVINVGSATTDNFYTIQGAFNYLRKSEATGDWTINVAEGKYHENLFYYGNANVKLVGPESDDYGDKAYVYWRNSQVLNGAQRARQSFIWQGGNLTIENMTFENTTNRAVEGNTNVQAETLVFDVAKDLVVYNSSFKSYQDTLLIGNNGGRAWFYNCYVAGDVDFIWGTADVCLLEGCKIVCRADGIKNDAKIFASRTVATNNTVAKGFILMNSEIEVEDGCSAAYGRSSGADTQASVFNNKFTKGAPSSSLWGSPSDTVIYEANGEMAVGYKDYNNKLSDDTIVDTSSRTKNTADMSERLFNREYSGRWTIFNRVYNRKTGAYEFASSIYDITSIASAYNAPSDDSINNIYVEPVYSNNIVGGKTVSLSVASKATDLTYTYTPSDTSLATVDASGTVTTVQLADGTVKITVTASNSKTDTASIKVIPTYVDITAVDISAVASVDLYALNTVTATITPSDASEQDIVWTASGDIKIVDPDNKILVTTLETSGNTIQIEGIVASGSGTITATAKSNSSASDSADVSVSDVRCYNALEAVAVNSKDVFGILNFQSGKVGIWHDIYVHAIYGTTKGKIAASGERIQSRYGTLYIPVTASCIIDMNCQAFSDSQSFATDFKDAGENAPVTSEGSEITYKYHYVFEYDHEVDTAKQVSGATVKALFDASTKDTSKTLVDAVPDENATYFAIQIPGADRYISAIKITKDSTIHHTAPSASITIAAFTDAKKSLDLNGTTTVTATTTATASDSSSPVITYASSNTNVATVNETTGAVSALMVGESTITATAAHSTDDSVTSKTATYIVHVNASASPSASYSIDLTKAMGEAGDYGIYATTTAGTSAKYYNEHGYIFGAGDTLSVKVAGASKVSLLGCQWGSGTATAVAGTTELTAATTSLKTTNCGDKVPYIYAGEAAATVVFTFAGGSSYIHGIDVEAYVAPSVTLSITDFTTTSETINLSSETTTYTQTTTASASDSSTPSISYSSTATGVATVDATSGLVTAIGIGSTNIKATASLEGSEDVSTTYKVVVKQTTATTTETFDFRNNGIVTDTSAAANFDYGILTGSAKYHGTTYGITGSASNTISFAVAGASTIYIGTGDYGFAGTISAANSGSFSATTINTVSGTKCTKTTLADAITQGSVVSVSYKTEAPTTLTLTASASYYLPVIWIVAYEAPSYDISLAFASASETLDLNGTTTVTQTATASGTDATSASVTYASSKTAVATVDSSSGLVTAVAMGMTTITATDATAGGTATYTVLVKNTATPSAAYSMDFTGGQYFTDNQSGTLDFGLVKIAAGSSNAFGYSTGHGATMKAGNSIIAKLVNNTVVLTTCMYDNASTITLADSVSNTITGATIECSGYTTAATITDGVITLPAGEKGSGHSDDSTITITLPTSVTGTVTLTYAGTGTAYLHALSVQ